MPIGWAPGTYQLVTDWSRSPRRPDEPGLPLIITGGAPSWFTSGQWGGLCPDLRMFVGFSRLDIPGRHSRRTLTVAW